MNDAELSPQFIEFAPSGVDNDAKLSRVSFAALWRAVITNRPMQCVDSVLGVQVRMPMKPAA